MSNIATYIEIGKLYLNEDLMPKSRLHNASSKSCLLLGRMAILHIKPLQYRPWIPSKKASENY